MTQEQNTGINPTAIEQQCLQEIQEVLNKHNCFLDATFQLSSRGITRTSVVRYIEESATQEPADEKAEE